MAAKIRIGVLGAGVIGLSTAVRIQEDSRRWGFVSDLEVTVIADRFSPHTTSDGSGGFWFPYQLGDTPDALIKQWSDETWDHILQMAVLPEAAAVGAQLISGYLAYTTDTFEDHGCRNTVLGYRHLTQKEVDMFPNAKSGCFLTTLIINVPKYLPWLMQRFKSAGGKTEFKTIHNLSQVAEDYDIIVNCFGIRGGQLVGDKHILPIRGQLFRVYAPWIKHFYAMNFGDGEPSYVFPIGDEVVIGGCAQRHNWKEEVDEKDAESMWSRAVTAFPFLKNSRKLSQWAGLRPGRTSVRLEMENMDIGGRTVPVVHNYGHGGGGVTLHWGCARNATELVHSILLNKLRPSKL